MNDQEDSRIIESVRAGNRDDYSIIVDRYKRPLFNLAYRMTGNYSDAEDLTQETFVKAYENLSRFDSSRRFFAWLYTISLNLIRNHIKKQVQILAGNAQGVASRHSQGDFDTGCQERSMMKSQDIERLNESLILLSGSLREAVLLRFHQGLSFKDMAEVSGISSSAAKMRVYRGLERLSEMMKGER